MKKKKDNVIAIIGPTASGKSNLGMALAERWNGEIVSCDSVQVYKAFDIGSAKPSKEEQARIPHHMIDLVTWKQTFDAARYRDSALEKIQEIHARGKRAIIVGGTGLYFRALCGSQFHDLPSSAELRAQLETLSNEELHKKLASLDQDRGKQIHINDRFRLLRACEIALLTGESLQTLSLSRTENLQRPFTVLCNPPREDLLKTISLRSEHMLKAGLLDEVESLLKEGCPDSTKPMQSIGYRQVCDFFRGDMSQNQILEKIIIATRQYARKQMMWFRKVPIDLEMNYPSDLLGNVDRILKQFKH